MFIASKTISISFPIELPAWLEVRVCFHCLFLWRSRLGTQWHRLHNNFCCTSMTQCQPGRILCHMRNIRPTAPGICDVEKYIATTEFITSPRTTYMYSEVVLTERCCSGCSTWLWHTQLSIALQRSKVMRITVLHVHVHIHVYHHGGCMVGSHSFWRAPENEQWLQDHVKLNQFAAQTLMAMTLLQ